MNHPLLVMRAAERLFALPLEHVEETMRCLPIEPLLDMPAFVRGACVVRGVVTPVVQLSALFAPNAERKGARMVSLRQAERRVALLVDEVLGVYEATRVHVDESPRLLGDAVNSAIDQLGRLDRELLTILNAARLLREEVWEKFHGREAGC